MPIHTSRLVPCPNVGQASTNHDLHPYSGGCFSYIVTNLHLSVKGVTAFVFRFTNDTLEKFLLTNSADMLEVVR